MATKVWQPSAASVAQIATASIDTVDGTPADNTFAVTIGNAVISTPGDTDVATTAAALVALLNASTHPYYSGITWTNPSGGDITATADTAGCPFDAALSVSGVGTGTVTDFADDTANSSPYDAGDTANWGGALPGAADDVFIGDTSVGLLYGLEDLSAVALGSVTISSSFTGDVGLERSVFATNEGASASNVKAIEYRPTYWEIQADNIDIGCDAPIVATSGGSDRICISNTKAGASLLRVGSTKAASSSSSIKPAVRYLAANAAADVEVDYAPAGVGIAVDVPGETATVGTVTVADTGEDSAVRIGEGTTFTNFVQYGGKNQIAAAATVTKVQVEGGELDVEGSGYAITTLDLNGGTTRDNHRATSGASWTTANVDGGAVLDLRGSDQARTLTTLEVCCGTVYAEWPNLTVTTYSTPTGADGVTVAASPGISG